MSYIENNLLDGENVVYQTKLHWIIFSRALFFFILSILFYIGNVNSLGTFFLVIGVIVAIVMYISYSTSIFAITNKRIIGKVGLIRRNSLELLLPKAESLSVHQGIVGRVLNFGTVIVTGTGGTKQPFPSIPAPINCRKIAQEQISNAMETK